MIRKMRRALLNSTSAAAIETDQHRAAGSAVRGDDLEHPVGRDRRSPE